MYLPISERTLDQSVTAVSSVMSDTQSVISFTSESAIDCCNTAFIDRYTTLALGLSFFTD